MLLERGAYTLSSRGGGREVRAREQHRETFFPLPAEISELLRSVTLLAHLTSDTMAHVSSTCLRAPPEPADCEYRGHRGRSCAQWGARTLKSLGCLASPALTAACKQFGKETLTYLAFLEEDGTVENDSTAVKSCLSKISAIGEVGPVLSPGEVTVVLG